MEVCLSQGTHRLFVTAFYDPETRSDWTIRAKVYLEKKDDLRFSLSPRRAISEDDIDTVESHIRLSSSPTFFSGCLV